MKIVFTEKVPNKKDVVEVVFRDNAERLVGILSGEKKTIYIGIGRREDMTSRKLMLLSREIIVLAKTHRVKKLAIRVTDLTFSHLKLSPKDLGELFAANAGMANFEFVKFKTPPKEGWGFVEYIVLVGKTNKDFENGVRKGEAIAREVNATRILANTPGGEMTPLKLANEAKKAAKGTRVRVRVLRVGQIKKLKMGGVLGVAQGSAEKPAFIILEYRGGKNEKPIVLVGKGVTFDTGGLNLKPSQHIYEMHMDMSGGAAVIHSVILAAKLKLKKNVIGLVPAVENMPSGSSYRPGDLLKTMSGKTIEVLDTDAEGRVILSDALTYAQKYKPRLVIDVATLTGAAIVALGQRASAVFTTDPKLEKVFREAGEATGDFVWPLPLWEEYESEIKGTFGDVANIGKTRYGGAITGAAFLWQFIKDTPWVHIDMAPRMTSIEGEFLAKGAAGSPVRLLLKILETA